MSEYDEDELDGNAEAHADINEEDDVRSEHAEAVLLFLGQSLVTKPDTLSVRKSVRGDSLKLTLNVPSSELGKVIGKGGRVANSIRTLVKVAGDRDGLETSVEFSDGRKPSGQGGRGGGGRGRSQGGRPPRRRD